MCKKLSAHHFGLLLHFMLLLCSVSALAQQERSSSARLNSYFFSSANPALPAASESSKEAMKLRFDLGGGVEYGNVEDLFELLDKAAKSLNGSGGGSSSSSGSSSGGSGGDKPGTGIGIEIGDILDPEYKEIIDAVGKELGTLAGVLAVVATEGYAKASINQNLTVLFNKPVAGGRVRVFLDKERASSAAGVADEINFNGQQAEQQLRDAWNLQPEDPETEFDLSGGLLLRVDPASGKVRFKLENDSLLLTKAIEETSLAIDYSRVFWQRDGQQLSLGIRPKFIRLGLTNVATRLGDLSDSEALFDAIKNAQYQYEQDLGLSLGLLWQSQQFSAGLSLRDVNSPSFKYPVMDYSRFTKVSMVSALERSRSYTKDPQANVEFGWQSSSARWNVAGSADFNAVDDPFLLPYQWLNVSASYTGKRWYSSSLRLGLAQNLAGTKLSYMTLGYTLFNIWNIELAGGLDTLSLQGSELPRSLAISTGLQFAF